MSGTGDMSISGNQCQQTCFSHQIQWFLSEPGQFERALHFRKSPGQTRKNTVAACALSTNKHCIFFWQSHSWQPGLGIPRPGQVLEFQDLVISLVYVLSFEHFDGWSLEARTLVSVIFLKWGMCRNMKSNESFLRFDANNMFNFHDFHTQGCRRF